jgi:hypothetical protein
MLCFLFIIDDSLDDGFDPLLDLVHLRMHVPDQLMLGARNLFDSFGHLVEFVEHCVLTGGNSVHPPKTDNPTKQIDPGKGENEHVYHICHLWPLCCQAIV